MGSLQTLKNNPSWLTAQYVIWAPAEMYKILVIKKNSNSLNMFFIHGSCFKIQKIPYGAYKLKTAEDWLLGLTMPNPEVVNDNIQTVHENEMHSAFWENVELSEKDYNVRARFVYYNSYI